MSDGSIDELIERKNAADADLDAAVAAKAGSESQMTDMQRRVNDVLERAPVIGTREALEQMAAIDPVIWTMYKRRLVGHGMTFDMARHLTVDALAERRKQFTPGERGSKEFERAVTELQQRHRPWQMEPLRDDHPHKAYKKARQVGITEVSFTEAVCFLDQHPNTILMYCVPEDAEILTRRGWKKWFECRHGDEALALDTETHTSKWDRIVKINAFQFSGDLRAVGPFHCTDDHRWPIEERNQKNEPFARKVVTASNLKQHHRLVRLAPHEDDGASVLSARLAAILGWVVTDGSQQTQRGCVSMTVVQSAKKHLKAIEELCGVKGRPVVNNERKVKLRKGEGSRGGRIVGRTKSGNPIYGDCFYVRVTRKDVKAILAAGYRSKADLPGVVTRLSSEARDAMWRAMLDAEGTGNFFGQVHGPVLDAFQILCALTGRFANLSTPGTQHSGCYVTEPGTQKARLKPSGWTNAEPRPYRGLVWCPMTPSSTWYMRYRGRVVFTGNCWPREKQLETFATTRIGPMFNETPRMRALLTGVNQVTTKMIGKSHMVMRSTWESGLGEGVNADVVVLDEKDRMKPGVEVAFKESMSASQFQWLREVSTPSIPNRGIDASWLLSDMREWFVRCSRCSMKQPITADSIKQMVNLPFNCKELPPDSFAYICSKKGCGGKLDRVTGEWVAKRPGVKLIRGYHMPQMIAEWIDATLVMQKKINYKFLQLWINYVLGEVSLGEGMLLTDKDFDLANGGHKFVQRRDGNWTLVSVGIDWGHKNWVVVEGMNWNGRKYIINAKMFEDNRADELGSVRAIDAWIENFQPDIIIADDGYGKDRNAYLLRRYGANRFFACRYNSAEKGGTTFTPRWSPNGNQVLCDRTASLKNYCRLIKDREIGFANREHEMIRALESHLKAWAPMMEEDDDTGKVIEVIKATGDDHLGHCGFYAELGMDYLVKSNNFNFSF